MPFHTIKVADAGEKQVDQKHIPTIDRYPHDTGGPTEGKVRATYGGKTSCAAIFYKAVPDSVSVAGFKYAFNPSEVRWRRMEWNKHQLTFDNFTLKVTDWGLCYVFNDIANGLPGLNVTEAGMAFGLNIALNANQDKYFYQARPRKGAGFQVVLYDRGTEPSVGSNGFATAVGMSTFVGADITEYRNLEAPYGDCEPMKLKYFPSYGHSECILECEIDFYIDQCLEAPACSTFQYFTCIIPAYDVFIQTQSCECPVPCFQREYSAFISTTKYPSTFWIDVEADRIDGTEWDARDNLCELSVYMKNLNILHISQQTGYTFSSLLSDIGGGLGLWIGGSILTCFEVFDLIVYSLYVTSKRIQRQKQRPTGVLNGR
ncbi:acid-sensing ion channel 1-like [Diadema setosum]|uniref:acid-sensing ion channel 1-like n=1 Tax=Diadema setosum TaxID=31175 RepID=UPI003B3ACF48